MAQTSSPVFEECMALSNHAEEIGVDLAIVMNAWLGLMGLLGSIDRSWVA